MSMTTRFIAVSAAAVAGASLLAACSSGSSTPAASGSKVGGTTECTNEIVGKAAQTAAQALAADNVFQLENLQCADGWAVASGILGAAADVNNTDAPVGAPNSFIFEAEGQFWVPKTAESVCGTMNQADPNAVPADATIPAALYQAGCLSG